MTRSFSSAAPKEMSSAQGATSRAGSRGVAGSLLAILRPKQWIKNCVIFAALVFSQTLLDADRLWRALAAFLLFCAVSSAVYILNDILDRQTDRLHPAKATRPIAAGKIPIGLAATLALVLAGAALPLSYLLSAGFAALATVYLLMNVLYSLWLKRVVIVDVMIIASGFVIRAMAGAVVVDVAISAWLILCTILLSLFLGFTKRRQELAQLDAMAGDHRVALREYSVAFLDQMIAIVTSATVVAYFLYTLAPETRLKLGTPYLPATIPFVLYGIFRYLYLVHQQDLGESPTGAFYADAPLFIDVLLWAGMAIVVLYLI